MWRVFEKAGRQGWEAIITIFNFHVTTKIIGKPSYWTLFTIIPYVGLIFSIWSWNLLVKKFGKDEDFTVGIIFLPFILFQF